MLARFFCGCSQKNACYVFIPLRVLKVFKNSLAGNSLKNGCGRGVCRRVRFERGHRAEFLNDRMRVSGRGSTRRLTITIESGSDGGGGMTMKFHQFSRTGG